MRRKQIVDQVLALPEGTRFTFDAPSCAAARASSPDVLEDLRAEGFIRVRVDGEQRRLEEELELDKRYVKHTIDVVVDRLIMRGDLARRLTDSIETAVQLADGLVEVSIVPGEEGGEERRLLFSERFACPEHGVSLAELAPRVFSFNSPHGACTRCHGLGAMPELDPDMVQPDPEVSIAGGALEPFQASFSNYFERMLQAVAERYEVSLDQPWGTLPADAQRAFLHGTGDERVYITYKNMHGRQRSTLAAFEGIIPILDRRYRETDSALVKERIEQFMTLRPCPACKGARLRPESLAVTVGALSIDAATRLSVDRALAWARRPRAHGARAPDRRPAAARDPRAPRLPLGCRRRLPHARPRRRHALGRRGAAHPARDADRLASSACSTCSTSPRSACTSATTAPLIETLETPARPRQHGRRGRARRGHDARRRLPHRRGPGRRRARRADRRGGHPGRGCADPDSLTGAYLSGRRRVPVPERRGPGAGESLASAARASTT